MMRGSYAPWICRVRTLAASPWRLPPLHPGTISPLCVCHRCTRAAPRRRTYPSSFGSGRCT
eukprot:651900-Prymnesium_polylepis.1